MRRGHHLCAMYCRGDCIEVTKKEQFPGFLERKAFEHGLDPWDTKAEDSI